MTIPLEPTPASISASLQSNWTLVLPVREADEPAHHYVLDDLERLHHVKSLAYGPSWRKHGEWLGIFANLTRKVDRLQIGTATPDEARVDTVADLATYAMLYRVWLREQVFPGSLYMHLASEDQAFRMVRHELALFFAAGTYDRLRTKIEAEMELISAYAALESICPLTEAHSDLVPSPSYKNTQVRTIAGAAIVWLALHRASDPEGYAAWAKQWHE